MNIKLNNMKNNMNNNINNYKKLNVYCKLNEYINLIKKFGYLSTNNKINDIEVCVNVNNFNPDKIKFIKQICNNCYCYESYCYDYVCYFISKNNEYVLSYPDTNSRSIIFYDINNNNEIKKFNNAHNEDIYTIKYYNYDLYDLILSTSRNNDIKLWNYNEGINILTIQNIFSYNNPYVYSGCLIFNEKDFKIFCICYTNNYIKVYNSNGIFNKEFGNNNEYRTYIDSFIIDNKKYLITGGDKGVHVFNYPELNEYFCFNENNDTNNHNYAKIIKRDIDYHLIDASFTNVIRIWNFFNKNLITKINIRNQLYGFTIINDKYLFIGDNNNKLKLFDIETNIFIKEFPKHNNEVIGVKPIRDKNNNNYLITYSRDNKICLWGLE